MTFIKVVVAGISVALAALLVLAIMGAIYSSTWTLDGEEIATHLNDQSFLEERFSDFRELHVVDFNGLAFTVTGRPSSALPIFSWESSVGALSTVVVLAYLALFLIILALLFFSLNKFAVWLFSRRGAA